MGDNEELEQGKMDKCLELLTKGYTRSQLVNDLGFSERTVDRAIAKFKKEGGVIKADKALAPSARDSTLVRKEKESVLPEWLEADVAEIFDGEIRDQKIFMAGMSVPLMGLRLFGEAVKPLTVLMTTWQEGQVKAAQAMQGSSADAAMRAAAGVGAQIIPRIDQLAAQMVASSPNPMMSMFAQAMQPLLGQVMGNLMGAFQPKPGQPQPDTQPAPGPQPLFQQPAGEQATEDEVAEAFG